MWFWPGPGQSSEKLVRVEGAKCRRECVVDWSRSTFGGSVARNARFGDLALHCWRNSCSKRWSWRISASFVEEVSYETPQISLLTPHTPSIASLAQSTLCLGSVVAPGRFARGMAERLQRSTPKLVRVAGPPSRLFGTKLRRHRLDDGIRNCRKKGRDVDMCLLLHLRDNRCTVGTQESKRAFRTRLPPKVTCQVPITSVSYETSSKTHMSKSAKRTFRTRLPPKVQRKHPSEHTHHAALPSSFAIPAPANDTRSHANPNVTATFTSATTHNLPIPYACHESFRGHTSNAHKVLRLPRNVTSVTHRNLTIPCACHENRTSTPQNPHKVLCLPRKVTMSNVISCELQQNLHHTTRLE